MASGGKVLLLACGSFNPPTFMHLRMFELARDHLRGEGVEVVGGVVSPVHDAYGKKDLAAAQHRIAMLRLALRTSDWIRLSDWETRQEGWSRTRMVLEHHQRIVNEANRGELSEEASWLPDLSSDHTDNLNSPGDLYNNNVRERQDLNNVRVKLLCGADLLESFATPGLWSQDDLERIVGEFGLVVISRAGSDAARFIHESDILYALRRRVTLVTNWLCDATSSTWLRRLLRRGQSVRYLTEEGVAQYARAHALYTPAYKPHTS